MNVSLYFSVKKLAKLYMSAPPQTFIERQHMKLILGGAFAVLAIIKLCELVDTNPKVGIPLVAVMTFAWMIELFRELRKAKK